MTEKSQAPENTDIPEAIIERRRFRSSQLVWLIPIIAMIIGISLGIKSYMEKGPVITITFKSGEGIEAGKTKIKYKDVQIGVVRSVAISADRTHVMVTADIFKDAAGLLMDDTRFWVVRARISGNGVSGLGTLMDGSYIGLDVGKSNQPREVFKGLERPPAVTMDVPGRQFILHARSIGSLDVGSLIFFRHLQVGEVVSADLDKDGKGLTLKIFVRAPYDQYVKTNTLFWHASGIDFTLDANGFKLNTESVVTILLGGISFQSPDDNNDAPAANPNTVFTLYETQDEALKRPDTIVEKYTLIFRESVRGLSVGAPVDLRGVTIGEVTKINLELDPRGSKFAMPVEIRFYPERLRSHYRGAASLPSGNIVSRKLLNELVEQGFRAQLKSASILTGQLFVALDFFPKAPPAKINWDKFPPELPTITGNMEQFQASLMQIVQKLERLPLEELAGDARKTVQNMDSAIKSADKLLKSLDNSVVPETRKVLDETRKTLDEARKTLGGVKQAMANDAPLQTDLRETLRELSRAAKSLRVLGDYLERNPEALIRGKKGDER